MMAKHLPTCYSQMGTGAIITLFQFVAKASCFTLVSVSNEIRKVPPLSMDSITSLTQALYNNVLYTLTASADDSSL